MIKRTLASKILESAKKFPAIAVTGPRQSGKTTLIRSLFPDKPYVSLEDLDIRNFATLDPRGFLDQYPEGAVLDEIQRAPEIFSYLQTLLDEKKKPRLFILTGSQHFLLLENISQTLAGRIQIFQLLPFSLQELSHSDAAPAELEDWIYQGMYPRIYDQNISPLDWYPSYIQTYVERDVRMVKNVNDLNIFQKFLRMCAARTGQILNLSSLANDCGITHNTAKSWINLLEASFILYRLLPHHPNLNKQMVKSPKIYFYDTGLACSLLGIESRKQVDHHALKGNLFETAILSEMMKERLHNGRQPFFYFWRDKTGHEIDCLFEKNGVWIPVEIKAGKTVNEDFFRGLSYWHHLKKLPHANSFLIYGGEQTQKRQAATVLGWKKISPLLSLVD